MLRHEVISAVFWHYKFPALEIDWLKQCPDLMVASGQ